MQTSIPWAKPFCTSQIGLRYNTCIVTLINQTQNDKIPISFCYSECTRIHNTNYACTSCLECCHIALNKTLGNLFFLFSIQTPGLPLRVLNQTISYVLTKTYVVGTPKNPLIEHSNHMFNPLLHNCAF